MKKTILHPKNFPPPVRPYFSWGVKVKDATLLFISGVVALGPDGKIEDGDIEIQTRRTMENLKVILEEGGATLQDIIKLTVYLTSVDHIEAQSKVRSEYFQQDQPASTLVVVKSLFRPEVLIEIEAIASI